MKRIEPALGFLDEALAEARGQNLLRERDGRWAATGGGPLVLLERLPGARRRSIGAAEAAGAGASRLLGGDRPVHRRLEAAAAELVGAGGFAGLLERLRGEPRGPLRPAGPRRPHRQRCAESRVDHRRGPSVAGPGPGRVPTSTSARSRRALEAPREGRAFVVTESYFSMDADTPDLRALRAVCDRHGAALIVDEAHALGVLGPEGRGLCAAAGVVPDVLVAPSARPSGRGGRSSRGARRWSLAAGTGRGRSSSPRA